MTHEEEVRQQLSDKILNSNNKALLLELATGVGKTKNALDKMNQWYKEGFKVLILVPRTTLIQSWKKEMIKWGYSNYIDKVVIANYASIQKYRGSWDIVIFDEVHHLSARCRQELMRFNISHSLCLSATIKPNLKGFLKLYFKRLGYEEIIIDTSTAISHKILPDPMIILVPLKLDNIYYDLEIVKRKAKPGEKALTITYDQKFKYLSYTGPLTIKCTQRQYYNELDSYIDWAKRMGRTQVQMHKSIERLQWLAVQKRDVINNLLKHFVRYRTLTFCPSIKESNNIESHCINSKVGTKSLDNFNDKKIKHISAVGMLDEGANLKSCRIGIFQMINSGDRITIQRIGRILRHKKPVLIYPYYENTREAEVVADIVNNYNKDLVFTIDDIKNIKLI